MANRERIIVRVPNSNNIVHVRHRKRGNIDRLTVDYLLLRFIFFSLFCRRSRLTDASSSKLESSFEEYPSSTNMFGSFVLLILLSISSPLFTKSAGFDKLSRRTIRRPVFCSTSTVRRRTPVRFFPGTASPFLATSIGANKSFDDKASPGLCVATAPLIGGFSRWKLYWYLFSSSSVSFSPPMEPSGPPRAEV